ncbi:hypothetical protein TNCV_2270471 [Trichonephila clavipes]|nr:hypothetical protein TNCV_2270471 [Trichonephila clavipes]
MVSNTSVKLAGGAHISLFERQTPNYLFTKLNRGAHSILLLRDSHRNANLRTKPTDGAQQLVSSSKGNN